MWLSSLAFALLGFLYGKMTSFQTFDTLVFQILIAVFMFFLGYGVVQHSSMLELSKSLVKHKGRIVYLIPLFTFFAGFTLLPVAKFFYLDPKVILFASLLAGWFELAPVLVLVLPEAALLGFFINFFRQLLSLLLVQVSSKNNLTSMSPSGVISMNVIYEYLQSYKVNTAVTAALSWMLGLIVIAVVVVGGLQ